MNADTRGLDPQGRAHQALADAVNDYGPRILSEPALLRNQLSDVLPDEPREGSLLVAAVEVGAAAQLREQVAAVGPDAAVEAVSRNMAQTRALDPAASCWAVAEIARALGYPVSAGAAAPPPPGEATLPWTGAAAVVAPSGAPPPGAPPATPPAYVPPPMPAAFVLPPAPGAYPPPPVPGAYPPPPVPAGFAAPPPVAGPPTGSFGPAGYGGPPPPPAGPLSGPFGPGPAGGGPPLPPAGPPPGPPGPGAPGGPPGPPGSGGPVGLPPAWAPPPSPPGGGNRMPLIAGAVVIVLIAGYIGLAAAAKLPPFKATATPTSTPVAACPTGEQLQAGQCVPKATATPSAAPTHSATPTTTAAPSLTPTPSAAPTSSSSLTPLANILPSYITGDSTDDICTDEPSSSYLTAGATDEELCDMSANQNVDENYILYVGFPTETPATSYFNSLLSGNGMKAGQGDCSSLSLATAADGSSQYCEGSYTTSGSGGSDFVFTGNNDFDLGNSTTVSGLEECAGSTSVDVVGFTDPSYAAVGVALDCEGGVYSDIYDDFTSGDLFLGS